MHSLTIVQNFIINSNKLPLYEASFSFLLVILVIHFNKNFLRHSIDFLKTFLPNFVNSLFLDYMHITFPLFILIYTDGSVSPPSSRYAFFIPDFHISFSNNLPSTGSSYTANVLLLLNLFNPFPLYHQTNYLLPPTHLLALNLCFLMFLSLI